MHNIIQQQTRVDFWSCPAYCYNTGWIWCQNAVHWNVEPAVQSSVFNRHVIHTTEIVSDNVQGQTQHTKLITYTIVEGQNIQNIFTA